jgi:hypothetical protein
LGANGVKRGVIVAPSLRNGGSPEGFCGFGLVGVAGEDVYLYMAVNKGRSTEQAD